MNRILRFSNIFILTLLVLGFSSCEKDNLSLLTDGEWQFENFTTNSENEDIRSLIALGKAIMTDGTLSFYADDTYIMDSPVINEETGTYQLVGNTQLIFNDGVVRTASIDEISKKKLVYLETYIYIDETTYTVTYTWVK